jgi:hypothetical protein
MPNDQWLHDNVLIDNNDLLPKDNMPNIKRQLAKDSWSRYVGPTDNWPTDN